MSLLQKMLASTESASQNKAEKYFDIPHICRVDAWIQMQRFAG